MIERNHKCQSYFWDIFTQENYFVWVREVFHKSQIPTEFNLHIIFSKYKYVNQVLNDLV